MEFSPDQGSFQKSISLHKKGHPESFAELRVSLKKGEAITYSWTAGEEVDFNIHSHREKEVDYHERYRGPEGSGRFEGPREDDFYLMWQNRSTEPVEVDIRVGL